MKFSAWVLATPLWLIAVSAVADPAADIGATAQRLSQNAASDPTAYSVVESLTTEIGPRLAGTDAFARASLWAQAKLKSLGLENVHAERFVMPAWMRGAESAQILTPSPQSLAITALGGSVATPAAGITAEVVLFRTYADLLVAPEGSLKGKIAVVTQHTLRLQDGSGYGLANPVRRAGASEAAKRGAIAYLHRSLGTDTHRLPHTGALNYVKDVTKIPAAALSNPDADQLERLAARGPVKLKLLLTPITRENAESWNIVGEIKGRERPDEVVLIGAHLDSWDLGTGATDDGAGVAIVSGAAKLIASLPQHPRRTVRVVLFGAEEMDHSGQAYAEAHAAEASHIVLAAEADFGARNVLAVRLPPGAAANPFGRAVEKIAIAAGAYLDRQPALQGGDDIRGLRALGVPVIAPRQDGIDYFDTHHTADDTLDKIDPKQLAQATGIWAALTYLAAESDIDFRGVAATTPQP